MASSFCWCCCLALAFASGPHAAEPTPSPYGGWKKAQGPATGWFRTVREEGRWWLVDPDGYRFLTIGVNHICYSGDAMRGSDHSPYRDAASSKHGSHQKWGEEAVNRLKEWGFNTVGAWSDPITWHQRMAYTVVLDLGRQVKLQEGQTFPDVFSPAFERAVHQTARRACRSLVNDRWLIGYFTDNELRWGPDGRSSESLFVEFLRLSDAAPGRQAVLDFLTRRYLTIGELNDAWRTEYGSFEEIGRSPQAGAAIPQEDEDGFLRLIADRYFTLTQQAIRAADPNHLILGCRFITGPPRPVMEAMKGRVDVVSLNQYEDHPPKELLRDLYRLTECPVIISEFSFRARDSGLPNTRGTGPLLDTQQQRADHCEQYLRELIALPMVVGYHWFQHSDQPAAGRFDGANSNYGLVNIQDEPYGLLVEAVSRVNRGAYEIAARGASR